MLARQRFFSSVPALRAGCQQSYPQKQRLRRCLPRMRAARCVSLVFFGSFTARESRFVDTSF